MRRPRPLSGPRAPMRSSPPSRASLNGHSTFRPRRLFSEPRGQDTSEEETHMARQTDHQTSSNAGFFVGLLVGTLIGAAVGVLLAPKSGTQLRSDVRDAAERSAEA